MFFPLHSVITLSRSPIHTYFYSDIFTDCLCPRPSFHGALFSSNLTRQLDPAWLLALVHIYIHILTLTFSLTAFVRVPLSKVHCLPLTSHVNLILSASIVLSGGGVTPYLSTDRFFDLSHLIPHSAGSFFYLWPILCFSPLPAILVKMTPLHLFDFSPVIYSFLFLLLHFRSLQLPSMHDWSLSFSHPWPRLMFPFAQSDRTRISKLLQPYLILTQLNCTRPISFFIGTHLIRYGCISMPRSIWLNVTRSFIPRPRFAQNTPTAFILNSIRVLPWLVPFSSSELAQIAPAIFALNLIQLR